MLRQPKFLRKQVATSISISRKHHVTDGPPGGWFPAGPWLSMMEACQQQGVRIMAHHMPLRSAKPLNATIIEKALRHLYRKSPPLRACLKLKDEKLWMCEMEEELIDFEEIHTEDPLREIKSQITTPFNPSGPLWRARFLPLKTTSLPPHIGLHLPYEYQLIIYIHHGIADAGTSFKLYGHLKKIINDLVDNKVIDNKQYGIIDSEKNSEDTKRSLVEKAINNTELIKNFHARCKGSLLMEAYELPLERNLSTGFFLKHLTVAETRNFIKKCKKSSITVNSALIAIVNTAIIELVKEHFVEKEYLDISCNVAVDNRRYCKEDASDRLGCIIGSLTHGTKTPVKVRQFFWEYAKDLHDSISKSYNEAEHLQQEILRERDQAKDFSHEKYMSGIPPVLTDFFFSNPGDVTRAFSDKGSQVEITAMIPYISMQKLNYTNGHLFHTYYGSLQYLLVFSEYYIDNNLAYRLANTVINLIKTV